MIFYFTGTGNSKFVAEELGRKLGEKPVSMFSYIKSEVKESFTSEKPLIFVTPTYAWRMPRIAERFVMDSEFTGCKDAYFVLTCGDSIGNAGKYAKKLCEDKGLNYKGIFGVVMPENYIAMFNAPEKEEAEKIVKRSLPEIDKVARCISQLKPHNVKCVAKDNFLSAAVNPMFYAASIRDKAFKVSDDCNSCGKCIVSCPLNNIQLNNGRPEWKGNCTHCMACICGCPKGAIEYGKKSIGKPRYQCPGIHESDSKNGDKSLSVHK